MKGMCFKVKKHLVFIFLTVPRAVRLGSPVVLFTLPFEARPVDTFRQELFRQRAESGQVSTPWFAPTSGIVEIPRELPPSFEESAGAVPPPPKRGRRRR